MIAQRALYRRWVRLLTVVALAVASLVPLTVSQVQAASLRLSLTPTMGPAGTEVTISAGGATPGSTVSVFWQPWPVGTPCLPTSGERYLVASVDPVGPSGQFSLDDRSQAFADSAPLVQGAIYVAAVGSLTGTEVSSNAACFTFQPAPAMREFPQTGFVVANGFLAYWEHFGGLARFGYPITAEIHGCDPQGWCGTMQYFERARFEWHPGSDPARYDVELGLVGTEAAPAADCGPCGGAAAFQPVAASTQAGCVYFPQTRHTLCAGFRAYWQQFGGLASYGYPISQEFRGTDLDNGQPVTLQYFQRALFEWHPGSNPARYDVALGRVGVQALLIERGDLVGQCHCLTPVP